MSDPTRPGCDQPQNQFAKQGDNYKIIITGKIVANNSNITHYQLNAINIHEWGHTKITLYLRSSADERMLTIISHV